MQIKKERAADSPFLFALFEGNSIQRGFVFELLFSQSSHKQLSLKHLLDKDFKSYLPLIMQQLTFSPAYDSLWIQ